MHKKPRHGPKRQTKEQPFIIESIDGLGQGVDKTGGKISFIGKVLPGETGIASITSEKKGVQFGSIKQLEKLAQNRIKPACIHYDNCPGCAYLHTDYQSEILYKKQALKHLFKSFDDLPEIEVHACDTRLHYRNRIQLHYRGKQLGLLDAASDSLVEIEHCQLPEVALENALGQLYQDRSWSNEHKGHGHCELALINGEVELNWDKPYAHGGFSQVNQSMNQKLLELIEKSVLNKSINSLADLFSGSGNLSDGLLKKAAILRVMADITPCEKPDFLSLNLFEEAALAQFKKHSPLQKVDLLLVDPPRKGFDLLPSWLKLLQAQYLLYVSCNAATLVRDLKRIEGPYVIEQLHLLDMFPATKHFETMALVRLGK